MINPLALISKLKKGDIDPDTIPEMLSSLGIDATFETLNGETSFAGFQNLARAASLPSSQLVRLQVTMKNGQTVNGLIVLERHAL